MVPSTGTLLIPSCISKQFYVVTWLFDNNISRYLNSSELNTVIIFIYCSVSLAIYSQLYWKRQTSQKVITKL